MGRVFVEISWKVDDKKLLKRQNFYDAEWWGVKGNDRNKWWNWSEVKREREGNNKKKREKEKFFPKELRRTKWKEWEEKVYRTCVKTCVQIHTDTFTIETMEKYYCPSFFYKSVVRRRMTQKDGRWKVSIYCLPLSRIYYYPFVFCWFSFPHPTEHHTGIQYSVIVYVLCL